MTALLLSAVLASHFSSAADADEQRCRYYLDSFFELSVGRFPERAKYLQRDWHDLRADRLSGGFLALRAPAGGIYAAFRSNDSRPYHFRVSLRGDLNERRGGDEIELLSDDEALDSCSLIMNVLLGPQFEPEVSRFSRDEEAGVGPGWALRYNAACR